MSMPLEGIRVLDWTIWHQGSLASAMLGDLGAEVIKIEDRVSGDPGRGLMKMASAATGQVGRNFYFECNNRSKKGIAVDLRTEKGKEIIYRLVEKSDVFVQNFRQGVAGKLGLDYATLSSYNPRLIYASATGWGPQGAESGKPSYDYTAQARSGAMYMAGAPDSPPLMLQSVPGDQFGATMTAYGVLAALVARERLGIGQEVDSSLFGSLLHILGQNVAFTLTFGAELPRHDRTVAGNPLWNHYKCADGKWLVLAGLQPDRVWPSICQVLGISELEKDPRFATMEARAANAELISILDNVFATRTRAEWIEALKIDKDLVFEKVNTLSDAIEDPQTLANEYITEYDHPELGKVKMLGLPVKFGKTPGRITNWAPELGQHTEEVLTEILGYSWDDIIKLKDEDVI